MNFISCKNIIMSKKYSYKTTKIKYKNMSK